MGMMLHQDGHFRILQLSDIQERADFYPKTKAAIEYLLDTNHPDLVILGGDNCFGPDIRTRDDLLRFLDALTEPLETRGVLWAHIFGNHDHDVNCVSKLEQQLMYEKYPHCVSAHSNGIHGVTNYYIDIMDPFNHPAFRIWCLDTNGSLKDSELNSRFGDKGLKGAAELPNMLGLNQRFDLLYFDQLIWLYTESQKLEEREGRKVPGILFCHMAPEEMALAQINPEECHVEGSAIEQPGGNALNSGLFSMLVQRGDIQTIAFGHTHQNSFTADYCGIKMCFDACAGYTCYGRMDLRGGRVFDFSSLKGVFETHMCNTADIIRPVWPV